MWSHEDERVSVHLGHRRLSIIDLSTAADQPMRKGDLALLYNGELYNYRALRAELSGAGVRFSTNSDNEYAIASLSCWSATALT